MEKTQIKLRKCAGCGKLKSREDMIKITKDHTNGDIVINPNSKTFGRSVYLCYNQNCIETSFKKNKIGRVLKTNTTLKKEDVIKLLNGEKGQLDG